MAQRNYLEWTNEKYLRFLKEGRGNILDEGKNYKPWWTVQDFPSRGRVSRLNGWKSKRVHHYFSDIETSYFYLLDWDEEDVIQDIREHFPLLDYDKIVEIDDLRLDKFTDKATGVPYVITTTFLITLRDESGKNVLAARSVKVSSALEKSISIERLEIERRFWEAKNVDWGIITEKELNSQKMKIKNIEWLHSSLRDSEEFGITPMDRNYISNIIIDRFSCSTENIRDELLQIDRDCNTQKGVALYIFKYLIASKIIEVDLNSKIDIGKSIPKIVKNIKGEGVMLNGEKIIGS
jgi:hypothetical protein